MGWLLLVFALAIALGVANVYWPLRRPGALALASSLAAFVLAELAPWQIALQAGLAGGLTAAGALETRPGLLGLVVLGAAWVALAAHFVRGARSGRRLEEALRDGFGGGYRDEIRPELRAGLGERVEIRNVLAPWALARPGVERVRDIAFAPEVPDLRLDVYRPRERTAPLPVLLYLHGGGWLGGSKNLLGLPTMFYMAARGWLGVNADYRLSPRATFPDHLIDAKRAIRWVRREAASLGADPDCLVVMGSSAGAHLAALVALTPNDPAYQPGFEDVDTRVDGCVAVYGIHDWSETRTPYPHPGLRRALERWIVKRRRDESPGIFAEGSPILRIAPGAPPFLLAHGDADALVPVAASAHLRDALRASGVEVAFAELPGAHHGFEVLSTLRGEHLRLALERFCALVRSRQLAGRGAGARPEPRRASDGREPAPATG